jgi:hypothetical protein
MSAPGVGLRHIQGAKSETNTGVGDGDIRRIVLRPGS